MDKKSKILIVFLILSVIFSIYLTYKRSFIDRDFDIINSAEDEN